MKFRTSGRPCLTLLFAIILCISGAVAAAPPAPSPVSPADGASVTEPFTISWTAVSDPSGIVAYNWQVSSYSAFTSVILQSSTSGATNDAVDSWTSVLFCAAPSAALTMLSPMVLPTIALTVAGCPLRQ